MPSGYHHLTYEQRCQIYTLNKRGVRIREIAEELEVNRSTIYRELKRNSGGRGYRFKQANEKACQRRTRANKKLTKMTPELITVIEDLLSVQWSPVQISGRLKIRDEPLHISHETIYKYIWKDKRNGGQLYVHLRHSGKKYNKRSKGKSGRGYIPNRVEIDKRPKIVDQKTRIGDWEFDTIISTGHCGAIVSMVDRMSKYTKLVLVPNTKSEVVKKAIIQALTPIKDFVATGTCDNGKEFSIHEELAKALDADFYFAKPYHSWERGLNEHTNGLVRQYFPKNKRFDEITENDVKEVEQLLNTRPRKVLNFLTPAEVFHGLTSSLLLKAA